MAPESGSGDCDCDDENKREILTERTTGPDENDFPPNNFHVINLDIFVLLVSIGSHIIDIAFDIHLAYRYYRHQQYQYFYLTALFIAFPAVVNTIISLRMYVMDEQCNSVSKMMTRKWIIRVLVLVFQLAPVLRYCDSLDYALKARRAEKANDRVNQKIFYEMMLKEDSDVALLRVFECFLEAAPQQILQTTILLMDSDKETTFQLVHQVASIISSLLSMAWSMASYHRSIRFVQEDKDNMSIMGTAMQFLWHFMITVSRILSISIVASLFPLSTAMGCAVHWFVMTTWLTLLDRAAFCVSPDSHPFNQRVGELLFCSILGLVYIFTYLAPGEGRTRLRYLAYYPLCFIENVTMAMIWLKYGPDMKWYFLPLFILSILPFMMGILFMLLYYGFFHPNKLPSRSPSMKILPKLSEKVDLCRPRDTVEEHIA